MHLPRRQERVFRDIRRRHLPFGSARWGAILGRGEEPHSSKSGGVPTYHSVEEQARRRGLLQVGHELSQPETSKYRKGRQGISLEDIWPRFEEDHREICESKVTLKL